MKKLLLIGMVLMLGISSTGFSARHNDRNSNRGYNERYRNEKQKNENKKKYNQKYSRNNGKINT